MSDVRMKKNDKFWNFVQKVVDDSEIIIDRPKGSCHPNFKETIYITDYGYLKNTKSADGEEIDVYIGSNGTHEVDAIAVTVDVVKRDSEIKILVGCTQEEIKRIQEQLNGFDTACGWIINKK